MIKVPLSKKNLIVIFVAAAVLLGGAVGYIVWRVNEDARLSEEESLADDCYDTCEWCAGPDQCWESTGGTVVAQPNCSCSNGYCCLGHVAGSPPGGEEPGSCSCQAGNDGCGVNCVFNGGPSSGSFGGGKIGWCIGGSWSWAELMSTPCGTYGHCGDSDCGDYSCPAGKQKAPGWETGRVSPDGCSGTLIEYQDSCGACGNPMGCFGCCVDAPPGDEYLTVSGSVYCTDDGGTTRYPVTTGVNILFHKANGNDENLSVTQSGNVGAYASAGGTTRRTHGGFAIRLTSLGDGTLSNGQPYSAMRGPSVVAGKFGCTTNGSYENCNDLHDNQNYTGFDFIYTNCSPDAPDELSCGDDCTTIGETCEGDNTFCQNTPVGRRCVDPDNWRDDTITEAYFQRQCTWPDEPPQNPEWTIVKQSNGYCIDEHTDNPKFRADYSIVVTNIGEIVAEIERVVDRPEDIRMEWLVTGTISPSYGVANAGTGGLIDNITWTLQGADRSFAVGASRSFSYSIIIPKEYFNNTYRNVATAYPTVGNEFSADDSIWASCKLPPTGIFDSVMSKIVLGTVLMMVAGLYMYSSNMSERTVLLYNGMFGSEAVVKRKKKAFKKKVAK